MRKKILAVVLAVLMVMSACAVSAFAEEKDADSIVVLFTNDVHCAAETTEENEEEGTSKCLGYASVAGLKKEMEAQYENVLLADAGDFIQGGTLGALSKGEYIIDMMNAVPYDVVTLGNHEFDYSVDRLKELADKATFDFVSSNFVDLSTNTAAFDAYKMFKCGDNDVAFVGVTTPESFTKSNPAYFKNEDGEYVYGFCQGNDGQDLYENVQASVDAALADGAEYVIALAHLGSDEESMPWTASEVISHVSGLDAMIDGHSHNEYVREVEDKDGDKVLLAQTGTALNAIGKLVIDKNGVSAEMVKEVEVVDEGVLSVVNQIKASLEDKLNEVIAKTSYPLVIKDPATGNRIVRNQETNLADLCADAYRDLTGADIAFVNGGGVRADVEAGDITFQDIINVHPFGNMACMVEVTGQTIIDALELGAAACPGESGGFIQVSGLSYTIDTTVDSTVVKSDEGAFVEVSGARRVKDVKVGEEAIDLEKTYTLASHNFMLKDGGDGYAMFIGSKVLLDEIMIDNEVLITYIQKIVDDELNMPETYADPYGEGRITILKDETSDTDTESDTDTSTDTESDTDTDEPTPVLYGDADDSGEINMLDVVVMQKHIAKLEVKINKVAADLDGKDEVTMEDVVLLQKFIAKLIEKFPVEPDDTTDTTDTATDDTATDDTATEDTASDDTDTTIDDTTTEDTTSDDTASEDTSTEDTTSDDTSSEEPVEERVLYVNASAVNWESVYAHLWEDQGAAVEGWIALELDSETGLFKLVLSDEIPAGVNRVVFSNAELKEGVTGEQTINLVIDSLGQTFIIANEKDSNGHYVLEEVDPQP